MSISDSPVKSDRITTIKFSKPSKAKPRTGKLIKGVNKKRLSHEVDGATEKNLLNHNTQKKKSHKLRIRKRGNGSNKAPTSCSDTNNVSEKKNVEKSQVVRKDEERINLSTSLEDIKSVSKLTKVSTSFSSRRPFKSNKKVKNEGASVNLCEKVERSGINRSIADKSASPNVVSNIEGQPARVRMRGKKRRRFVKGVGNKSEHIEDNIKKPVNNNEPLQKRGKRMIYDPLGDNIVTKKRKIESIECSAPQKQNGNNLPPMCFQARKSSTNLGKGPSLKVLVGNGQNKIIKFEDDDSPPSSRNLMCNESYKKLGNAPSNAYSAENLSRNEKKIRNKDNRRQTCYNRIDNGGDIEFNKEYNNKIIKNHSNKIQRNLRKEADKIGKSTTFVNGQSIKCLSGNGQNKKIRFDDNEIPTSSMNFNKFNSQQSDASNNAFSGQSLSGKLHKKTKFECNRELNSLNSVNDDIKPNKDCSNITMKKSSNKIQPELGNKNNKIMKPNKELASGIKGKNEEKQAESISSTDAIPSKKTNKADIAGLSLRERMLNQLKSSRFRFVNQQLYTSDSNEANVLFQKDPVLFQTYHEGFKRQVEQWPINPIDRIIRGILRRPATLVVADFGCGDAKLAKSVPNKVHSFDLVALSDEVTVCDMANTPLKDASVDICVFCLSLMGTNFQSFIIEANRVLKMSGVLKIVEVASRFEKVESFIRDLKKYGFAFANKDFSHNLFYFMNFTKSSDITKTKELPPLYLKPCMYKKR